MRRLRKATQIGFRERLETACPQAGLEIDRIEGDWLHATTAEFRRRTINVSSRSVLGNASD